MCLIGQTVVFEEGVELLEQTMGVKTSAPQIQRVCEHYGGTMERLIAANCEAVIPELEQKENEDTTYVMMDGSMIYTREDGWREVKLGRIFHSSQVVDIQEDRKEIMQSMYVSHLGSVDEFFPKFERFLVPYKKKVVLGDGAPWIWRWFEDNYPGATQILDYYHACEKLVIFAKHQFKKDDRRMDWINKQANRLLENELEQIMLEVRKIRPLNEEAKESKNKLIRYYTENDDRMQYKNIP